MLSQIGLEFRPLEKEMTVVMLKCRLQANCPSDRLYLKTSLLQQGKVSDGSNIENKTKEHNHGLQHQKRNYLRWSFLLNCTYLDQFWPNLKQYGHSLTHLKPFQPISHIWSFFFSSNFEPFWIFFKFNFDQF